MRAQAGSVTKLLRLVEGGNTGFGDEGLQERRVVEQGVRAKRLDVKPYRGLDIGIIHNRGNGSAQGETDFQREYRNGAVTRFDETRCGAYTEIKRLDKR